MAFLAASLIAAAVGSLPEARTFWRPDPGPTQQPVQKQVAAHLVHVGARLAVYQEDGYAVAPAGDSGRAELSSLVEDFEDKVLGPAESLVGPAPDVDGNGKIILLVTRLPKQPALFWRWDLMPAREAATYGFQSNEGEILYTTLEFEGNGSRLNLHYLAGCYVELLMAARSLQAPGDWGRLAGSYAPFALGVSSARSLWGDYPPTNFAIKTSDPASSRGWSVLFFHYLVERLGEGAYHVDPGGELAGVTTGSPASVTAGGPAGVTAGGAAGRALGDLLADFAMACWLDDPFVGKGQYAFGKVDPPRPAPAVLAVASRPTSGVLQIGIGGFAFVLIQGSQERSFPLTLQGDRAARWSARAVVCRHTGRYEELPVEFSQTGTARVDLPNLGPSDHALLAVAATLTGPPGSDSRTLPLLWGVGWVPHVPPDTTRSQLAELLQKATPDGGVGIRARLHATLVRLCGVEAGAQPAPGLATVVSSSGAAPRVTTRYACAPESALVPELLVEEAGRRGLPARLSTFQHSSGNSVTQTWSNVLVNLPGSDERRWPVVLAVHWDAIRGTLDDSFHQALGLNDNAAGVAIALEVAAALSRTPHRGPVLVAFLAGGCEGAAGAQALLGELKNKVTAWVELEAMGEPDAAPRGLWVRLEGEPKLTRMPLSMTQALKDVGLQGRPQPDFTSPHCGASIALERGVPALVVRAKPEERTVGDVDIPVDLETAKVSEDLMALLAKAVATSLAHLAGND
jgi:hypothetical protein